MINRPKTNLSKSLFIKGCQCPKALWLTKYHPEFKQPYSINQRALFDEGIAIGKLAQSLFPNGYPIDQNAETIPHRLKLTQTRIEAGDETLYEATFQAKSVLVMCDVLHSTKYGWDLYEVKSSSHEKPTFIQDLALQYHIVSQQLPDLNRLKLVLINPNYERKGELNISELFQIIDVTEKVKKVSPTIEPKITELKNMLSWPFEPQVDIGLQCSSPYDCEFISHCWQHLPSPSIFDISGLHLTQKIDLYKNGILHLKDIPQEYPLTAKQQLQVQTELSEIIHIQKEDILAFLNQIHYPLYFLDFEAFQMASPPFDRLKPYQQVAFQYSLHYQMSPTSEIKHTAFLAMPNEDPRELMAISLAHDIPENACVVSYSAGYEKLVFKQLAHDFPEFSKKLLTIESNILDLMTPFEKKQLYTKAMNGSHSIKMVLPALVPELNYDSLNIKDGLSAALAYQRLHISSEWAEIMQIKNDLLEYCKMDTLAMVKLLEKLKLMVG